MTEEALTNLLDMCFYNQKQFSCGDWSWTSFAHQCTYEYRIGETCGIKLVNKTETKSTKCCLCDRIETKYRRREAEEARLARWMREGAILVASMDRSRSIIKEIDREIFSLRREREYRRKSLSGIRNSHSNCGTARGSPSKLT